MPRVSRSGAAAGVVAIIAAGGAAIVVGASGASGGPPRSETAVTVFEGDGTRAPAVDAAAAKDFEEELSALVPGFRFVDDESFDYADRGGADYIRLTGNVPGLDRLAVSVYRHFDASELRAAKLTETSDPSSGTFWVGALDRDLTSVYFQPTTGTPVWVGEYALATSGPAPALTDVQALAVKIAGLPSVKAMARGET